MHLLSSLSTVSLAFLAFGLCLPQQLGFGPSLASELSQDYQPPTIKVPVQLAVMSKVSTTLFPRLAKDVADAMPCDVADRLWLVP